LKHVAETWAEEVRRRLGRWEAIERLLADLVSRHPYVECLYFYDGKNQQNALVANRQLLGDREVPLAVIQGEGFSSRPWYTAAVAEGQTILTPVFDSLLSGRPIFTAASPVYAGSELAGVLGLDVNIDSWTKI
jgi:methyl-accepting chemotaxis protein